MRRSADPVFGSFGWAFAVLTGGGVWCRADGACDGTGRALALTVGDAKTGVVAAGVGGEGIGGAIAVEVATGALAAEDGEGDCVDSSSFFPCQKALAAIPAPTTNASA
ncbi:MAG: hypothetical protein ACLQBL_12735, partial [Polyangiaceae bacterium]